MIQAKFSIEESQAKFLDHCKLYGFKDKSEMVRQALEHLKQELVLQELTQSATLYAEIYEQDADLQALTEAAVIEWPV